MWPASRVEHGGSGDPSPWTALGVEAAIRVTCEALWGTPDLAGRTIAVIGLGHVGGALARGLAAGGASLRPRRRRRRRSGRSPTSSAPTWAEPAEALRAARRRRRAVRAGRRARRRRRCRSCAAARSPAPRTTSSPTDAIADALHARGILWTPDFVANAGGIINIAVELEPEGYDPGRARDRVRARRRHRPHPARRRPSATGSPRSRRRWRSRASGSPSGSRSGPPRGACRRCACSVQAAGSSQPGRDHVPGVARAAPRRCARRPPRGDDAPLALEPVGDVLVELRGGILDRRGRGPGRGGRARGRGARRSPSR